MIAAFKLVLAAIMSAILAVSVVDVGGRYLFNAPLFGADDLIRFGMALIVFLALPAVCRAGEHITVDLLRDRMPFGLQPLVGRIFNAAAVLLLAFLCWRLLELGLTALRSGDTTPILRLPYPPLIFFMSACAAVAAMVEAGRMLRPSATAQGGR